MSAEGAGDIDAVNTNAPAIPMVVNTSVIATEASSDTTLDAGAMSAHFSSGGNNSDITRVRVRGICEGQPVSDDCESGDACWKTG